MHIHQRINSRKLMLSYLYHYCFLRKLTSSMQVATQEKADFPLTQHNADPFFDQHFLADLQAMWEASATEGERAKEKLTLMLSETDEEDIFYYLKHFFDQRTQDDIDKEYVLKIGGTFTSYMQEIETTVNTYTESFSYQQMDIIDQAIFLLGYTERKILQTPREILINEMVELAKRYSDEGAPKLINGIMDKVIEK